MCKRKSHKQTRGKSCTSNPALHQLARPSPTQQKNESGLGVGGTVERESTLQRGISPGSCKPDPAPVSKENDGFRYEGNPLYTVEFSPPALDLGSLALPKNGKEHKCGSKKILAANEHACNQGGPKFFFCLFGNGEFVGFLLLPMCSHEGPTLFPSGSQ